MTNSNAFQRSGQPTWSSAVININAPRPPADSNQPIGFYQRRFDVGQSMGRVPVEARVDQHLDNQPRNLLASPYGRQFSIVAFRDTRGQTALQVHQVQV